MFIYAGGSAGRYRSVGGTAVAGHVGVQRSVSCVPPPLVYAEHMTLERGVDAPVLEIRSIESSILRVDELHEVDTWKQRVGHHRRWTTARLLHGIESCLSANYTAHCIQYRVKQNFQATI